MAQWSIPGEYDCVPGLVSARERGPRSVFERISAFQSETWVQPDTKAQKIDGSWDDGCDR